MELDKTYNVLADKDWTIAIFYRRRTNISMSTDLATFSNLGKEEVYPRAQEWLDQNNKDIVSITKVELYKGKEKVDILKWKQ
mgnify:CR=1 FL=1